MADESVFIIIKFEMRNFKYLLNKGKLTTLVSGNIFLYY